MSSLEQMNYGKRNRVRIRETGARNKKDRGRDFQIGITNRTLFCATALYTKYKRNAVLTAPDRTRFCSIGSRADAFWLPLIPSLTIVVEWANLILESLQRKSLTGFVMVVLVIDLALWGDPIKAL